MRLESAIQNNQRRLELRDKQRNGSIKLPKNVIDRMRKSSVGFEVKPTAKLL